MLMSKINNIINLIFFGWTLLLGINIIIREVTIEIYFALGFFLVGVGR